MSDLVQRLRSVDVSWSETGEWCAEAADRIEALQERNDALALQADEWEGKYAIISEQNAALQADLAAAEQRGYLRGLEEAAGVAVDAHDAPGLGWTPRAIATAIRALKDKQP